MMSLVFTHAHSCSEPHSEAIWGISWTALDTVISISADGTIQQWSAGSGQPYSPNAKSLPAHPLAQVSLSVSPDGRLALYNSIEGHTCLMDLTKGEVVGTLERDVRTSDSSDHAWSVSLNPNGETYASCGASGDITLRLAKPDGFGKHLSTLSSGRNKFGMFCAHSPDGKRIASASNAGQIFIFDLESNSLIATYSTHAMSVRSLAWSGDSNSLLSASEDKRVILHDVRTPTGDVSTFIGHSSWVLSADISPDGRLALSGSADKCIKVWDIATRSAVSTIEDTGKVWAVSWRPKPAALGSAGAFVSGGDDGVVRWWSGAGGGGLVGGQG